MDIMCAASEYVGVWQPEKAGKVMPHLLMAAGMASRSAMADIGKDAFNKIDRSALFAEYDAELWQKLFVLFVDRAAEIA